MWGITRVDSGLLLFLIYINDLCIVCKSTEPVLFADDTNLFSSGSNAISLLKCIYYSSIYPYMIYCNQVCGSAYKTNIEPLLILRKIAVSIVLGIHPSSRSQPLFTTLNFLNCENILIKVILPHVWLLVISFRYFFPLHPLHPWWNIFAICETDKESINPTGFQAPFAPMIMWCCICTGIYTLLWWYVCDVYYTMLDGKQ